MTGGIAHLNYRISQILMFNNKLWSVLAGK